MVERNRRGQEGFTLVEAAVAIFVLFLTLTSLLVAAGSQHRHLQELERYAGARGVVNVGARKAVVSVFSSEAGGPSCELRLAALEPVGGGLRARAQVGDPGTLPEVP
jgi:hypothetical protein